MECNIIDIEIHVRTGNMALLTSNLPAMGGLFAEECRNSACLHPGRDCRTCTRNSTCDWYRVFGQVLSVNPEALRRHQKPPLPFVFSFPMLEKLPASSGVVVCGLVVIGSAISCLGMLLEGFGRLLSVSAGQEKAEVFQLLSRDYQGTLVPLVCSDIPATKQNLVVLSLGGILESHAWGSSEVEITLRSPLKLRNDGHQLRRFEFGLFARSLLRRMSSLVYYYESCESGYDFKYLSQQADAITCSKDNFFYDRAPSGIKKLSGITGQGRFSGDFTELVPFLVAGSYFHVGKSASFGMGRFSLSLI